jgi:hypothetical protein
MGAYENYSGPDVTAPKLQRAQINNPTQVVLFFTEPLNSQSAQNAGNYSIDNGVSVLSASLSSNNRDVTLTTSAHTPNIQHTVTVSSVTDLAGNTISSSANSAQYLLEVVLFFTEPLNSQSAQNAGNYNIDNGVSVVSASLSSNNQEVTLTTSTHTPNIQHTVTVSSVTDLAGNTISSSANSAQYLLEADVTAPEVSSAQLDNATTLNVFFSEQVQSSSATNIGNYSINNGIQVTSAVLSGNNQSVQLTTSDHPAGQSYTVVVSSVLDLAGNPLSQQVNSANYTWDGSTALYRQNISGAYANDWYLDYMPEKSIDGIVNTTTASRWAGAIPMPDSILFDLGASRTFSSTRISFYEWDTGRIYEYALKVSNDLVSWQTIVASTFSTNTQWSEETFSPVVGRYLLLVSLSNNQSQWAGVWEAEIWGSAQPSDVGDDTETVTDYVLNQNYPNPFNPATNI